jgi:uncharacterized short protein YbdD (DUF466 family)
MENNIKYPSYYSVDEKEKSLALFVERLRYIYHKNKLSNEEVKLCESIPGWKWGTIYNWVTKEEFIQWCKDNKIKIEKDFRSIKNRPDNIPSTPQQIYKDWSWGDVSGNYINRDFVSKEEFIQWCKDNGVKTQKQFNKTKRPDNIHSAPQQIYKDWSWGDVSGNYKNIDWVTKEEFIQWCKDNKIKSQSHFKSIKNRPDNIPSIPNVIYENFSWGDVSGRYINIDWVTKEEFIQWCKDNGVKSERQFRSIKNRPDNIPSNPQRIYKDWLWGDVSGNYKRKK